MALTDSLVSYWKMDESSGSAADSVGSNTLTNNGTIVYAAGKINNGADLEVDSLQYFSAADSASLSITGNLSLGGWFKLESAPGAGVTRDMFSKYNPTGNQRSYLFRYQDTAGTKQFETRISSDGTGANTTVKTLNYTLNIATWYHVIFVYTAATGVVEVFVNGVSVGTMTAHKTSIFDSTALLEIGANGEAAATYDGLMDELGIWSRALSAGEVSQLYNGGNGSQYSFTDVGIAFDAVSNATVGTGTSLTFSHTCTGSNRILFVGVLSGAAVTGINYGGAAMTQIINRTDSGNNRALYYLIAPSTGANNIVITAGSSTYYYAGAISYTGAKQSGQPDASTTGSGLTVTSLVTSLSSVANNCWFTLLGTSDNGGAQAAGTGSVKRTSLGTISEMYDSNSLKTPAGSYSMTYSGPSGNYYGLMASFAPVSTASSTFPARLSLLGVGR